MIEELFLSIVLFIGGFFFGYYGVGLFRELIEQMRNFLQ